MELTLTRIALRDTYTIGRLFVDGKYFCDTLEDKVRDLNRNGRFDNGEVKVNGQTAIPYGRYAVTIDIISPKYSKSATYKRIDGKLPRLLNVPHFDGVLIHAGNTAQDTNGCVLVGENTVVGKVLNSVNTFYKLYPLLQKARLRGEKIWITIK